MADRKKKLIVILAVLCCVLVVLAAVLLKGGGRDDDAIFAAEEETGTVHTVLANEKCVMENDRFTLELDEKTMGITVVDKTSGQKYYSTQDYTEGNKLWNGFCSSGISLEFYSGNSSAATTVSVINEEVTKSIQYFSDGFDADLGFGDYGFQMQLQVRLMEDGVCVHVPGESLKEGDTYFLGAVWLYPMMGATLPGEEEGYMVIPEGSGAIIDLKDNNKKFKNAYTKMIYGGNVGVDAVAPNYYDMPMITEPEEIRMPIFGMVYTEKESAFLGIVAEGEYHADLVAYPNGVTTPYNWVTAKFRVRDIYTKQTARTAGVPAYESDGDFRSLGMKYLFAQGEEANYTGLANMYQDYLVKEGMLAKQEDSFEVKLDFFGADSEKWLIFNSVIPMTTVEEMGDIIGDLLADGVTDILPVYTGYQTDGATLNYGSTKVGVEGKLGSKKSILSLAEDLQEKGIQLTLQQELLLANASKLYDTTREVVKGINQVIVEKPTFQKLFSSMYYQTPARSMDILEKLNREYKDTAINAVSICGLPEKLYSYYFKGTIYSRRDCAAQYRNILLDVDFEKVGMVNPNAYLWDLMAQYYDIPMSTSGYNYIAQEIPFLQTVLRGYVPYWAPYVNFESNEQAAFLKMLEYGAYPSFLVTNQSPVKLRNSNSSYIYTSEYSVLKEKILAYEKELSEVFGQLEGSGIKEHRMLDEDVVMTKYKNGVTIYINYSENEFRYGDIVVLPLSYILVK